MSRINPVKFLRRFKPGAQTPSVRNSLFFSTAQQYTNFLISFPSIMILSRLLTPTEVGVYSVALTFMNVVHMLRDMGTSEYLVQVNELDNATARTAFTINLIIAWFLAVVLFFASSLLADFFAEQGVGEVLRILTLMFVMLPIGATVNAILVREMLFALRYKIALANLLTQNGVTIILAWYGFGYHAPAWGAVAGMAANVAGCFYWAGQYRIRGLGLARWRAVTYFGVQKSAGTIMSQLGSAAPDFVIGRMLGMAQVGLFSRGYGLARMFRQNLVGAIGAVSYSAYAKTHREGNDVGAFYLKSITYVTGLGWPFLLFGSLMAYPLIRIFFGDQWDAAIPILRYMAIYVSISLCVLQYQDVLTAIGRVGLASLWTAIWQTTLIVMLVIACNFGLVAVAIGFIPCGLLLVGAVFFVLKSQMSLTAERYFQAIRPSLLVTICAMIPAGVSYMIYTPGPQALWGPTIAAGVCWLGGALLGGRFVQHPIWMEIYNFIKTKF